MNEIVFFLLDLITGAVVALYAVRRFRNRDGRIATLIRALSATARDPGNEQFKQ